MMSHGSFHSLIGVAVAIALLTVVAGAALAQNQQSPKKSSSSFQSCLPAGIAATDIVKYGTSRKKNITVATALSKLKARCKNKQLVDRNKKEIRFFKKTCWGHPPPNYEELQKEERRNLELLQSRYVVVVIECDPRIP